MSQWLSCVIMRIRLRSCIHANRCCQVFRASFICARVPPGGAALVVEPGSVTGGLDRNRFPVGIHIDPGMSGAPVLLGASSLVTAVGVSGVRDVGFLRAGILSFRSVTSRI